MSPKDEDELADMMKTALQLPGSKRQSAGSGGWRGAQHRTGIADGGPGPCQDGSDVAILGLGPLLGMAKKEAQRLESEGYAAAWTNLGFVKGLDREMLEV